MIVSSALMIWKGLMVVTGSESPIVVVLSGSMEPAFHRGDLLFLTNYPEEPVRVGEIVVFKVEGRDIPIVHRVIKLHEKCVKIIIEEFFKLIFDFREDGTVKFLTKGDNNSVDDRGNFRIILIIGKSNRFLIFRTLRSWTVVAHEKRYCGTGTRIFALRRHDNDPYERISQL